MRTLACLRLGIAAAFLLQGCSGGRLLPNPSPAAPAEATAGDAALGAASGVKLTFKIPRHRGNRAHYLSQSTGSIVVTVFNAGHTKKLVAKELDTVPGLNGCTPITSGTFTCPMSLSLRPGTYAFDVQTYDASGGKGVLLAALKDYLKTVAAGKADSIHLVLNGIPSAIDYGFVGTSPLVTGNGTGAFEMAGTGSGAAQTFQLFAEDGDQNVIVGTGAPAFALITNQTSNLSIAPVAGHNGLFTLTPLHHTTVAMNLTMEAIPGGNVAQPIYASASLSVDQLVYVANPGVGTVTGFAPWSSAPVVTIPKAQVANPYTIALDPAGNLYVADFQVTGTLQVFAPGSTTPSRTITGLTAPAFGLAVDGSGDIFVTEYLAHDVKEFTPSGGSTPSRTLSSSTSPTGINNPAGLAVDAAGNLYVANNGGTIGVSVYAPGTSTTPAALMTSGITKPAKLAFDSAGDLYVSNNGGNSVTEYAPPLNASSPVLHTFTSANTTTPFAVAIDGSNNVWVGQASGGHVVEFAPNQTVSRTISGYGAAVYGLATDGAGDAFVVDYNNNAVDEFSPASGTTPINALTNGVSTPTSVIVW